MKNISKTDILCFMLMMSCDIKYAFYCPCKSKKLKIRSEKMPLNVGYLTCDRTAAGDEVYTPYYAVRSQVR